MQQDSYKYWAFISYSHRDQVWADWLHKALETYRVPRRLVGRETAAGPVPRRLFPVFRDLEELPSSPNLSGAIDQALLQSRYLIVIASPYAAVSKWVDQEIARFRAMGRGDRILCLIVDGEPHADLQPGRGFLECFPPSLRAEDGFEPIAADVRPGKDGKPATKLKLIAGLLGIGLDELRRRERRRLLLQRLAWGAFSFVAVGVLFGLWTMQQQEKREALAQQARRTHIETMYEKGRQELQGHNEARAAVYLNDVYGAGVDTPALRFMLGQAMSIVDSEALTFQTGAPVSALKFSPNARLLITTGNDGVARVWDATNGSKKFEIHLPQSARWWGPQFSRDNRYIYLGTVPDDSVKGTLYVWAADSGRLLANIDGSPRSDRAFNSFDGDGRHLIHVALDHAAEIYDIDTGRATGRLPGNYSVAGFSRDGRRILLGAENGEVTLWDAAAKRKLKTFSGLRTRIVSLDDTEDGSLVSAAAQDGSIRVWLAKSTELRLAAAHPSPRPFLVFNIDGSRLLTKADDGARIWNTINGALIYVQQFPGAAVNKVDISSDGRWVMTSSSSRLTVQDVTSGSELFTLDGHHGFPQARDISENDQLIATGGPDGLVVLWNRPRIPDFEFRHLVDPLRWANEPRPPGVAAAYSHSGKLIATGGGDGFLSVWDANSRRLIYRVEADSRSINVINFSEDDADIVTGGEIDGLKIWDVKSGHLIRALNCDGRRVLTAALSSDGHSVAAAIRGGVTWLWDAGSGERLEVFKRDEAWAGQFSPDGKRFAVGAQGSVKLWDIAQRTFVWSMQLGGGDGGSSKDIAAMDFSPDGHRLAVGDGGRRIFVLNTDDGKELKETSEPASSQINTVKFSHDGKAVVTSDLGSIATLWQPDTGQRFTLHGHAGEVLSAVFSPDDTFILTSAVDATAKIWDTNTGELLDTAAEHNSRMPEVPFQAAGFSPDGRWILTGSVDGVIRLWELRKETRSPQRLERMLRCRVPWRLEGENLVPSTPNPAACAED